MTPQLIIEGNGLAGTIGNALVEQLNMQGLQVEQRTTPTQNCNVFIHAAARHPVDTKNRIFDSNVGLLSSVLSVINPKTKLIFLSSNSVFEQCSGWVDECTQLSPVSLYSVSKWAGEKLIQASHHNHLIFRLPAVLSQSVSHHLLARKIQAIHSGNTIKLSNKKALYNNFILLQTLVEVLALSIYENKFGNGIYNLAPSAELTFEQIASVLVALPCQYDPAISWLDNKEPGFIVDNSKIQRVLGGNVTLGLEQLSDWANSYSEQFNNFSRCHS